ncbi:hypothetical protein AGMMS50262_05330 [Bacteroidia bacterium]|nr:hypothetical protein AGMMS50262_05330 [Bacteroidia bacterium]
MSGNLVVSGCNPQPTGSLKCTLKAEAVIKRDNYPWENLIEINGSDQIWIKYGIGNVAGSEFLIDEKGTIVAVAPSVDEIRDYLIKYYTSQNIRQYERKSD